MVVFHDKHTLTGVHMVYVLQKLCLKEALTASNIHPHCIKLYSYMIAQQSLLMKPSAANWHALSLYTCVTVHEMSLIQQRQNVGRLSVTDGKFENTYSVRQ